MKNNLFRIAIVLLVIIGLFAPTIMCAQNKLFSLEDLNFGGTNYFRMQPQNLYITWWGEQLMYQDAESGGTIDNKGQKKQLFTLDEVNEALKGKSAKIRNAFYASYPYPDQPLVLCKDELIKDRNGMDLTEVEDIKKRWQEYTEELNKKRSSWTR